MRILLAEDRASLRSALAEILQREGYEVELASQGAEAMSKIVEGGYDLALFDLKMPVHSGLELLKASKEQWPSVPAILLTAYGSVEIAVEAMRSGAFDFLSKPVDPDLLLIRIHRALDDERKDRVEEAVREDLSRSPMFQGMIGESPSYQNALEQTARIAKVETSVLLLGETGVGKELFARAIHTGSSRRSQPFVAVNCAAIPGTLLENELFGHEKGAYTGAHDTKMGRFELANRGTLFLDEIGEMHPDLQSKLLRVLDDQTFHRVGGNHPIRVNVRLICATNRDLEELAGRNQFRMDLYYRVSAFPIRIPPLRDRREDIPKLAQHYLKHFARELSRPGLTLTEGALEWLSRHPWPGNIRELINRVERASILADTRVDVEHLEGKGGEVERSSQLPTDLFGHEGDPESWLDAERRWRAAQVLNRCGGERRRASRLLGMKADELEKLLEPPPENY
jgi:DNA-binding NtrC family response regulator